MANPRILSVQSLEAHHRPPVPHSQCVCRLCLSEVEDEEHALLYYNGSQYLEDLRSDFFKSIFLISTDQFANLLKLATSGFEVIHILLGADDMKIVGVL